MNPPPLWTGAFTGNEREVQQNIQNRHLARRAGSRGGDRGLQRGDCDVGRQECDPFVADGAAVGERRPFPRCDQWPMFSSCAVAVVGLYHESKDSGERKDKWTAACVWWLTFCE